MSSELAPIEWLSDTVAPDPDSPIWWEEKFETPTLLDLARRVGMEIAGSTASLASLPPNVGMVPRVVAGGLGALAGKNIDELLGNTVGEDKPGFDIEDVYAGAGGALVNPVGQLSKTAVQKTLTRQNTREVADLFRKYGIRFTPGSVSDNSLIQGLEARLKEMSFSRGVSNKAVKEMWDDFGKAINYLGDDSTLRFGESAYEAGSQIARSAANEMDAFYTRSGQLHNLVTDMLPSDTRVPMTATKNFLENYAGKYPDEFASFKNVFSDPLMQKIDKIMNSHEAVPWRVIDEVRRAVGRRTVGSLTDAGDPRLARALYRQLSEDMTTVAQSIDPVIAKAWNNAKRYHRRYVDYVDNHLAKVTQQDPEKVFSALQRGNLTDIIKMKTGMEPETWTAVRSLVLQKLGQPTPGTREIVGDAFDPNIFFKNYNKLRKNSPEVLQQLFGKYTRNVKSRDQFGRLIETTDPVLRSIDPGLSKAVRTITTSSPDISKQLEELARIAEKLKQPGKQANLSGTSQALAMMAIGEQAFTGGIGPITVGIPAGLYTTAKLWNSKKFLDWLIAGKNTKRGTKRFDNWIAAIPTLTASSLASEHDDKALEQLKEYLSRVADIPSVPEIPVARTFDQGKLTNKELNNLLS
tara:strand:+ start:93 stop:1997 length:1905 start_codon:yes stop_codon:yes gene_type:complete